MCIVALGQTLHHDAVSRGGSQDRMRDRGSPKMGSGILLIPNCSGQCVCPSITYIITWGWGGVRHGRWSHGMAAKNIASADIMWLCSEGG